MSDLKLYLIHDRINDSLMIGVSTSESEMETCCKKYEPYKNLRDTNLKIEELTMQGYEITVRPIMPVELKSIM